MIRPKPATASPEIASMSWQHTALLRELGFDTVLCMFNVRRGAAAQTPSITLSEEEEADLLEDMVDQLPPVPDTPIVRSQNIWFRELLRKASTPVVGGSVPPKIGCLINECRLLILFDFQ